MAGNFAPFSIGSAHIGPDQPLAWLCGPCVMESYEMVMETAAAIAEVMQGRPWVFKSCYDKANRSSGKSFRGPGMDQGLQWLADVQSRFQVPVTTDVHTVEEAAVAGRVVDCLQIPAFLCRQTDLVLAAAQTGAAVNVKKGQFMAPWDMGNVVEKIRNAGNSRIILTERGTSFGYNNLVVDFRSIPEMQKFGVPVCFDATHSCQSPCGLGSCSGGNREYSKPLALAAVAMGADIIFLETHPNPPQAKCDADVQWPLQKLRELVEGCDIVKACHSFPAKFCEVH